MKQCSLPYFFACACKRALIFAAAMVCVLGSFTVIAQDSTPELTAAIETLDKVVERGVLARIKKIEFEQKLKPHQASLKELMDFGGKFAQAATKVQELFKNTKENQRLVCRDKMGVVTTRNLKPARLNEIESRAEKRTSEITSDISKSEEVTREQFGLLKEFNSHFHQVELIRNQVKRILAPSVEIDRLLISAKENFDRAKNKGDISAEKTFEDFTPVAKGVSAAKEEVDAFLSFDRETQQLHQLAKEMKKQLQLGLGDGSADRRRLSQAMHRKALKCLNDLKQIIVLRRNAAIATSTVTPPAGTTPTSTASPSTTPPTTTPSTSGTPASWWYVNCIGGKAKVLPILANNANPGIGAYDEKSEADKTAAQWDVDGDCADTACPASMVEVPYVTGVSDASAFEAITGVSLIPGFAASVYSNYVADGITISQSPFAGECVAPSSTVTYTTSLGPPPISTPARVFSASLDCGGEIEIEAGGEPSRICRVVVSGWNLDGRVSVTVEPKTPVNGIRIFPGDDAAEPYNMSKTGISEELDNYYFSQLISASITAPEGPTDFVITVDQDGGDFAVLSLTVSVLPPGRTPSRGGGVRPPALVAVGDGGPFCVWRYKMFGDPPTCFAFASSTCDNQRYADSKYELVGSDLNKSQRASRMIELSRYGGDIYGCRASGDTSEGSDTEVDDPVETLSEIFMSPTDIEMLPGESVSFSAFARYSTGREEKVSADFAPGRVFTAVKSGTYSVTASYRDKSARANIEVKRPPLSDVKVKASRTELKYGETANFTATALYGDAGESEDITAEASWSPAKSIKGDKPGVVTVSASYQGYGDSVDVTVLPLEIVELVITPSVKTIDVGERVSFKAIAVLENEDLDNVTNEVNWTPASTFIGKEAGSFDVTASLRGQTASASVEVLPPQITELQIQSPRSTIKYGESVSLSARAIYSKGIPNRDVTAEASWSPGSTIVGGDKTRMRVIASYEGVEDSITINVLPPVVTGLTIWPARARIRPGDKKSFSARVQFDNAPPRTVNRDVQWAPAQTFSADTPGTYTVVAIYDGMIAKATVTVISRDSSGSSSGGNSSSGAGSSGAGSSGSSGGTGTDTTGSSGGVTTSGAGATGGKKPPSDECDDGKWSIKCDPNAQPGGRAPTPTPEQLAEAAATGTAISQADPLGGRPSGLSGDVNPHYGQPTDPDNANPFASDDSVEPARPGHGNRGGVTDTDIASLSEPSLPHGESNDGHEGQQQGGQQSQSSGSRDPQNEDSTPEQNGGNRQQGQGRDGKGNDGKGNNGKGNNGKGNDGKGNDGKGNDGKGNDGQGNDGKGNDGKGNDGKGNDRKGNDGKGNDGKGNDGKGNDGKGKGGKGKGGKGNDGKGKGGKGKGGKGKGQQGKPSGRSYSPTPLYAMDKSPCLQCGAAQYLSCATSNSSNYCGRYRYWEYKEDPSYTGEKNLCPKCPFEPTLSEAKRHCYLNRLYVLSKKRPDYTESQLEALAESTCRCAEGTGCFGY